MPVRSSRFIACLFALLVTCHASADPQPGRSAERPARVMLLGLFHFDNPGLDAVKFTPIDVMKAKEQAYLQALSARIAAFKPTKVLLEYPQQSDELINQRYADYLAGKYELKLNEIYQLGFRIAKLAGLKRVHGFDERDSPSDGALWEYLEKDAPATMKEVEELIATLSRRFQHEHRTMSLRDLLRKSNSPEDDNLNKGFYLRLNDVGASRRKFVGADAAAQWWQRNFRMYANVQLHATPGERVVVIAGSGHTAILRDLVKADPKRVEEKVAPYL